ncbi:MAG: hypothetical protein SWY16_15800 [Cyanobacteriota bacterium]|nr:hypothetical protein [Cyanobacteriota bacterium]
MPSILHTPSPRPRVPASPRRLSPISLTSPISPNPCPEWEQIG